MLHEHPRARRISFVSMKLRQWTHQSWMESKYHFQLNSDNELANRLLELVTHSTVSSEASNNNNIIPEVHHNTCFLSPAKESQLQVNG